MTSASIYWYDFETFGSNPAETARVSLPASVLMKT